MRRVAIAEFTKTVCALAWQGNATVIHIAAEFAIAVCGDSLLRWQEDATVYLHMDDNQVGGGYEQVHCGHC